MQSATINRFLKGRGFTGKVQRQKLLYYAQAWHLAWYGRPLFEDRLEAWPMGPVAFHAETLSPALGRDMEPGPVSIHLDAVCGHYGPYCGNQLRDRSHMEAPWQDAWANTNKLISQESLMRYFSQPGVPGPQRPAVRSRVVDDDVLDRAIAELAPTLAGVDRFLADR